jgi:hypothetical protein
LSWATAAVLATANRPAKAIDNSLFMFKSSLEGLVGVRVLRGARL